MPFKIATIPAVIRCCRIGLKLKQQGDKRVNAVFPRHKVEKKLERIKGDESLRVQCCMEIYVDGDYGRLEEKKIPMQMSIRRHMMYR